MPRVNSLDSSLSLLREGYPFVTHRRHALGADAFRLRLLGEKSVCISGAEAAALFYDQTKFRRRDALPRRVLVTLMGQAGVQTLDGAEHRHRKAMFMSVMTPRRLQDFTTQVEENWRTYLRRWAQQNEVELFTEVGEILCRAACTWTGTPFEEKDLQPLSRDLTAMIDGFGGVGPRYWRGKRARTRAEQWVGGIIDDVRAGRHAAAFDSPLAIVAGHRQLNGQLLPTEVAAVELLNLLRPIVAIATYVAFEALALHEHPAVRARVAAGDAEYRQWFVQEVRRYYPFTPILGARVRTGFEWRGHRFRKGTLVILGVHDIDHDERLWDRPREFRPERFAYWDGSPFNFIPQGGGDYAHHHRCAGEWLTIETMQTIARLLTTAMTYEVPPQDLSVDLTRMPTRPASGFIISHVRVVDSTASAAAPAAEAAAAQCPFHAK